MIPGRLDLPTMWIGCDWLPVILRWKDANGNPINLTGWTPFAHANNTFDLSPVVTDAVNGVTQISMSAAGTSLLKLGEMQWDWVWQRASPLLTLPPILSGKIPVKQPNTIISPPPT